MKNSRKMLARDRKGALEGLPLYLIILVVIASAAMVIMTSWMGSAQTNLGSVEAFDRADGDAFLRSGQTQRINVFTYDTSGAPLEGVSIVVTGAGLSAPVYGTTKDTTNYKGHVELTVAPNLQPGQSVGELTITAKFTGDVEKELTTTMTVVGS
jgi:hypothetical protein